MSVTIERGTFVPFALAGRRPRGIVAMGSPLSLKRPETPQFIRGYATRYNCTHYFQGRFDIFEPGVFAKTLLRGDTVRLLDMHDESRVLATTNDGGLELLSDGEGLSFLAQLPCDVLGRTVAADIKAARKVGMSVGYRITEYEDRRLAGEDVRFIRAAQLSEISIVDQGAVPQAYVELTEVQEFKRSSKIEANRDAAFAKLMRATAQLRDALDR